MEFLDKNCKTESQKQLSCVIISKLIPNLESVSFFEIQNMLEVVADGIQKYEERDVQSDNFAVGDAIHQYLKVKLKKQNIDLLIQKD